LQCVALGSTPPELRTPYACLAASLVPAPGVASPTVSGGSGSTSKGQSGRGWKKVEGKSTSETAQGRPAAASSPPQDSGGAPLPNSSATAAHQLVQAAEVALSSAGARERVLDAVSKATDAWLPAPGVQPVHGSDKLHVVDALLAVQVRCGVVQ
jgi:hypothetical protein